MRIVLIGVAGIGTCLLSFLPRFLAYKETRKVELVLVDGDAFDARNLDRQSFSEQGNKAEVKAKDLRAEFPSLTVFAVPEYVTLRTIKRIIRSASTILLAVDNHATRLLVSQRCQELRNVTLISGGNDLETGSVQVYRRRRGENISHPLEFFHSEIRDPKDQNPGEILDCFQMASEGDPQIVIANMAAALGMACALYQVLEGILPAEENYFNIRTGVFRLAERSMYVASS